MVKFLRNPTTLQAMGVRRGGSDGVTTPLQPLYRAGTQRSMPATRGLLYRPLQEPDAASVLRLCLHDPRTHHRALHPQTFVPAFPVLCSLLHSLAIRHPLSLFLGDRGYALARLASISVRIRSLKPAPRPPPPQLSPPTLLRPHVSLLQPESGAVTPLSPRSKDDAYGCSKHAPCS